MVKDNIDYKSELKLQYHEFVLLRDFISERFGIYFQDDKQWLLEVKLTRLMQNSSFKTFLEYFRYLIQKFYTNNSYMDEDFIEIIRVISNNETYFYRESTAFEIMRQFILPRVLEQKSHKFPKTIRVLSAGCSTGEEAYSIAISLFDLIKTPHDFRFMVIGVDIDNHALEKAKTALYKSSAFRGMNDKTSFSIDAFKEYFSYISPEENTSIFTNNNKLYNIKDSVKKYIKFQQINILDLQGLKALGSFDIIFCRNVLIYFNEKAKNVTINNFGEIMNPEGYLFLGHSESIIHTDSSFNSVEKNRQIFYQKSYNQTL